MAIDFITGNSRALLDRFNARIAQNEPKGKITTWKRSDDGKYYTHTADQWRAKAWLTATVKGDRLVFNIIKPQNANVTWPVYAFYHGHLIETFVNHFHDDFASGSATAMPTVADKCQ